MILTITPNPLLDYHVVDQNSGRHHGTRLPKIPCTVGGKGINVARMLKTLGRPALALTFAGGNNGAKVIAELQQQGICGRFVVCKSETRMGINLLDESNGHRWWMEEGEELCESEILNMLDLVKAEAKSASFIAMSGSIPGRHNADFYRRVLHALSDFAGEVYVDARGEALRQAGIVGGFFLKHNRDEAIETFGLDPFIESQRPDYLSCLATRKIWGAMVTDGKNDVFLWDGHKTYVLHPAPAREVSSVGCGDATLAGLIYGRKLGMGILESALLGMAAGAADVEKPGPCEATFPEIEKKLCLLKAALS